MPSFSYMCSNTHSLTRKLRGMHVVLHASSAACTLRTCSFAMLTVYTQSPHAPPVSSSLREVDPGVTGMRCWVRMACTWAASRGLPAPARDTSATADAALRIVCRSTGTPASPHGKYCMHDIHIVTHGTFDMHTHLAHVVSVLLIGQAYWRQDANG